MTEQIKMDRISDKILTRASVRYGFVSTFLRLQTIRTTLQIRRLLELPICPLRQPARGSGAVAGFQSASTGGRLWLGRPHILSRAVVVTMIGNFSAFAALAKATTLCFSSP